MYLYIFCSSVYILYIQENNKNKIVGGLDNCLMDAERKKNKDREKNSGYGC